MHWARGDILQTVTVNRRPNPTPKATATLLPETTQHNGQKRHNTTAKNDTTQRPETTQHNGQKRHNTTARNDTTQRSEQTPEKEVEIKNITVYVSGYTETDTTGMLSPPTVWRPTKWVCFEPTVWPDTCCSEHWIRVSLQWTKRLSV